MARTQVTVAAVGLVPAEVDQLRLMVYRPNGDFPRTAVAQTASAKQAAAGLMASALPPTLSEDTPPLEEAGFLAASDEVQLIYTAVLPLVDLTRATPLNDEDIERDWTLLTPWIGRGNEAPAESLSAEHALVRNYWRRQLEETTAVLDFLPQYFTTAQVRAAYSSLWAEDQHLGAFHRWLHERHAPDKTPLVERVDDEVVRAESEAAFARALKQSDLGPQVDERRAALALALGGSSTAGVSAALIAGSAIGFLPAALAAGAFVGSRVAYQRRASRGKQPLWYRRCHQNRVLIDDPYPPRPRWLSAGASPGPFH